MRIIKNKSFFWQTYLPDLKYILPHVYPLKYYVLTMVFFFVQMSGKAEILISEEEDQALFEILNLRTATAQKIIDGERNLDPGNLFLDYLENWNEVIELMAFEEEERYQEYLILLEKRMEKIENNMDPTSPMYHILLGEMYAHAAMANVMYGDYLAGFRKLLKANRYARKNLEEHPGYWLNDKLIGIMSVSFDEIPPILKWLTSLFGLKGDAKEGYDQLDRYLESVKDYPGLKSEALLYYVFALKLSQDEEKAYAFLSNRMDPAQAPTLNLYLYANILYLTGRNDQAMAVLTSFPEDQPEIPFHHLDYLEGKAKMNRLDSDAYVYMHRFLENSAFRNYKREISVKLSQYYFIQDVNDQYLFYKNLASGYPKATTNRDREADVENERPYDPHPSLLKIRYLVAGGYYKRADQLIRSVDPAKLTRPAYQTEYYLLSGRIHSSGHLYPEASSLYDHAINVGRDQEEHYAAEAALLAGNDAYAYGDIEKATNYWELSLEINGQKDVFIEEIHKKAKNQLDTKGKTWTDEFRSSMEKK